MDAASGNSPQRAPSRSRNPSRGCRGSAASCFPRTVSCPCVSVAPRIRRSSSARSRFPRFGPSNHANSAGRATPYARSANAGAARSIRRTSATLAGARVACSSWVHNRTQRPGPVLPARPARCSADARSRAASPNGRSPGADRVPAHAPDLCPQPGSRHRSSTTSRRCLLPAALSVVRTAPVRAPGLPMKPSCEARGCRHPDRAVQPPCDGFPRCRAGNTSVWPVGAGPLTKTSRTARAASSHLGVESGRDRCSIATS